MKRNIIILLFLICLVPGSVFFSQNQQTASISGTITMPVLQQERRVFRGRMYRNRLATPDKNRNKQQILQSSYIDIIVSARPLSFKYETQPLPPVKILQLNAEFLPKVTPVTPGTIVQFINRDNFFHNVFSITPGSHFNIGRRPTGDIVEQKITKIGETKLFCDIHTQMNATIICLDTPYITRVRADGRYQLSNLPPGSYEVQIYHPDLTSVTRFIEISSGESATVNFRLNK